MVISIIIGIVVLVIAFVIYREYKNEKRYQEERAQEQERKKRRIEPKVTTRPSQSRPMPQENPSTKEKPKEPAPQPKQESRPAQPAQAPKSEPTPKKETTTPPPSKPAVIEKEIELPKGEYPEFNYSRLKEMGLSEEEALEFIQELIPQIGDQIPLLDEAMAIPDFHQMERLTHSIKGSSTTIGTGGVSDLLVDYNTYLKTGDEVKVAEAYQAHLKRYYELLKKQFPKES